jgi:hypothetical protein
MSSSRPSPRRLRRSRVPLLFAVLLLASGAQAQQFEFQGPNLVVNGNFDAGLSGWIEEDHDEFTSNWISYENFGSTGGSLQGEGKTDPPPDRHPITWQCMTVKPGRNYRFEGALKSLFDDEVISGGSIQLSRATPTGCAEDGTPLKEFFLRDSYEDGPWEPNGATVRIPAGVNRVRVATVAEAGNFLSDARQDNQSNFLAYDAVALRELLGDFVARFGAGVPGIGTAREILTIPVEVENRSVYEAHSGEIRFEDRNRFILRSETCPGTLTRVEQGANSYFSWQGFGSPFSPKGKITCSIEVEVKPGATGNDPLRLTATSDNDWNYTDNTVTTPFQVALSPDLAVEVSTTEFPQPGQTVNAVMTFRNLGTASANGAFSFEWTNDDGERVTLSGFSDSCSEFFYDQGLGVAAFPLAPGAVRTCTLGFTWPLQTASVLRLTLMGSASGDFDTSNNVASTVSKLLTLRVNTPDDLIDFDPGDGICSAYPGTVMQFCSLRGAIMEANAIAGAQTIELPVLEEPYRLTRSSTDGAENGDVQISGPTRLIGEPLDGVNPQLLLDFPVSEPGRAIRVESTASTVRITNLDIVGQPQAFNGDGGLISHRGDRLVLRDVSLSNGRALGKGGAIHALGELDIFNAKFTNNAAPRGGAIALEAPSFEFLEIADTRFSGNGDADTLEGGALWLSKGLVGIDRSTLDANRADRGGGIYARTDNFATLLFNSTLTGNIADLEGGALWAGSGIGINTSTVADNHATPGDTSTGLGGGAFVVDGVIVSVYGSIFAGNTGRIRTVTGGPFPLSYPDAAACHGALDSDGYNTMQSVSQDQLCAITGTTGDNLDSPATLGALADNGGPTPTRALLATGNEVDRGPLDCRATASAGSNVLTADQRGSVRPADGDGDGQARCDKGAFERADAARVTVVRAGSAQGFVSSSPSSIFCGETCSAAFASNQSVTLTAQAASGHRFMGWSGACSGSGLQCTFNVSGNASVTATFEDLSTRLLTVTRAGNGNGSVSSTPAGIACPGDCSESYSSDVSITLTATAAAGSTFAGWSGDCSGTATCTLLMDGARQASAEFSANSHAVSIALGGDGAGKVAAASTGIDCPGVCAADVPTGTVTSFVATPDAGSVFARWGRGPCSGSTTPTCDTTITADLVLLAEFETVADPTLTVEVLGAGSVGSSPAGVACAGPGTCSADFVRDTSVTLTATSHAGQEFIEWRTGPCAGSTTPTCVFPLEGDLKLRAEFGPAGATGDLIFNDSFE